MINDNRLDQLFAAVRSQKGELSSDFGFQTRLLASIHEARAAKNIFGILAWRMLPAFAAITLMAAIYNEKNSATTDLAGSFLGENALTEILAN